MVDIFNEAKEKVFPKFATFKEAGDSVQGTYVGKIIKAIDGYGNEQIIYQLLQTDGAVLNVGFRLNKKLINKEMDGVHFGQIVGFKYKGELTVKDRFSKMVKVKDYSVHQDPKIVDEKWIAENKDNMPTVTVAPPKKEFDNFEEDQSSDIPFQSSVTVDDKLAVINKLAADKLGVTNPALVKDKVMEVTGLAFLPMNYDKIIAALNI